MTTNPCADLHHMLAEDMQRTNEYYYSRKFLDKYLRQEIEAHPDTLAKVHHGVELLEDYRSKTYSYASKNQRVAQLADLELEPLVLDMFVGVAYCQTPELFTSITAQLASRLGFDDKREAIQTVAEMLAVLCITDAFDILNPAGSGQMVIQSRLPLSQELLAYVVRSNYLPPMACPPQTLTSNYESGYLTHNDCLVLGKANGHNGDLCLDVLNTQNQIPLQLDTAFLSTVEEEPTFALDTPEKLQDWSRFKRDSYDMYQLMAQQGNRFYLTNKVDKRGRMYAQGYHITPQGSGFKKAMLEFAEEEIVDGVPRP